MDREENTDENAAAVAGLVALHKSLRFQELAKSFAEAHGHGPDAAGSIFADQRIVALGWSGYANLFRSEILDWVVGEVSQFKGFQALLDAENAYCPTMRIDQDWRMLPLADAYDAGQEERGDSRRAFRAMPIAAPADELADDAAPEIVAPRP